MLIDNIIYLKKNYQHIREFLNNNEQLILQQPIDVIRSKAGMPTLQFKLNEGPVYIHSKYDPYREAEALVKKYEKEIEKYQHIFFYGAGLGYHIEEFMTKFPRLSFTIYEPNDAILFHYLKNKKLENLPLKNLKNLFLETSVQGRVAFLKQFSNNINENVLLVTLPSYERIFNDKYQDFLMSFKDYVKNKRSSFQINLTFEKRWTINSIINFPKVLETPNILHDIDKSQFKGKPVLLVAAGPSLNEEINNIRLIKEKGLAYIFSVGSAINTLIENNIFPDAACTYDPTEKNQVVFQKLVDRGIEDIPLIFGSSVGFETLQNYPGPKLHMLTTQDTVSEYFLKHPEIDRIDTVQDSPSIAVITLQLLYKLGVSPIILVGQNLAYKNEKQYAEGINYSHVSSELGEKELSTAIIVSGTDGKEVLTNEGFNRMRQQMEMYIGHFNGTTVINTTRGGASIKGTLFITLKNLLETTLTNRIVGNWLKNESVYELEYTRNQIENINDQFEELVEIINRINKHLIEIQRFVDNKQTRELERKFNQLDRDFKKLVNNTFYKVFLKPMIRVQFEIVTNQVKMYRFEKDLLLKGSEIVKSFGKFIFECKNDLHLIGPLYKRISMDILPKLNSVENQE